MQLLTLTRKIKLYKQIYKFNYNIEELAHLSWNIKDKSSYGFYTDIDDFWLRLICSDFKKLQNLLDQIIAFIILKNKSISIDGKMISKLNHYFSAKQLKRGLIIPFKENIPLFEPNFINYLEWKSKFHYLLLNRVFSNKDLAIKIRIKMFFIKDFENTIEDEFKEYVNKFDIKILEQLFTLFGKFYLASIYDKKSLI